MTSSIFFENFFIEISICFDGNRPARYDLLLVDDENIGLAFKLGALGAEIAPSEQHLITWLEVESLLWIKKSNTKDFSASYRISSSGVDGNRGWVVG